MKKSKQRVPNAAKKVLVVDTGVSFVKIHVNTLSWCL